MAKKSQINRDNRRKALIAKYAERRAELRAVLQDAEASIDDKLAAQEQFAKLPRNSCPTRLNRRCQDLGSLEVGYYRKFGISRIALRDLALSRSAARRPQVQLVGHRIVKEPTSIPIITGSMFVDSATGDRVGHPLDDDFQRDPGNRWGGAAPHASWRSRPSATRSGPGKMRELDADGKIDRFRKPLRQQEDRREESPKSRARERPRLRKPRVAFRTPASAFFTCRFSLQRRAPASCRVVASESR